MRFTLDKTNPRAFDEFIAAAREVPEVVAIETFLGRVDVRLNVIARDMAQYQEVYRRRILALPHIAEVDALMLIATIKDSEGLAAVIDLDDLDRAILRSLSLDAGVSAGELGRRLGAVAASGMAAGQAVGGCGGDRGRAGGCGPRGFGLWRDGVSGGEAGHQGAGFAGGF